MAKGREVVMVVVERRYVHSVYRRVVSIEVFDNRDSRFPFGIFIARRERERFISRSESTPSFTRRWPGTQTWSPSGGHAICKLRIRVLRFRDFTKNCKIIGGAHHSPTSVLPCYFFQQS